jgi:hypothetical protein
VLTTQTYTQGRCCLPVHTAFLLNHLAVHYNYTQHCLNCHGTFECPLIYGTDYYYYYSFHPGCLYPRNRQYVILIASVLHPSLLPSSFTFPLRVFSFFHETPLLSRGSDSYSVARMYFSKYRCKRLSARGGNESEFVTHSRSLKQLQIYIRSLSVCLSVTDYYFSQTFLPTV